MLKQIHNKVFNFTKVFLYRPLTTCIYKMDNAYVRRMESESQFQLTFRYSNSNLMVNRVFNLCRQSNESVAALTDRIAKKVEKIISKKKNKKNATEALKAFSSVNVELLLNDSPLDREVICKDLFNGDESKKIVVKIFDNEYRVIIDSPWVDLISLPNSALANFPVSPSKFETVFVDRDQSKFEWYKSKDQIRWSLVSNEFVYIPTNEDVDHFLKFRCVPRNDGLEGPAVEEVSKFKVEASPGVCLFENRHRFTEQRATGNEFRVVSYNILADLYCDSDFTRSSLFPYCPPYALHIDYRRQLILKELIGYNADIICLQEVDKKVYDHDLKPLLHSLSYDSNFKLKGGTVAEGLACFFNTERFKKIETNSIILGEHVNKDPIFSAIWEKVCPNEKLSERLLQRTTAIQTVALECLDKEEILLVANTHLYFHPDADHIRLLQGGLAIRYINHIMEQLKQKTNKKVCLIFCGDFNSTPDSGIYTFYTQGKVSENLADWSSNKEEEVKGLSLEQPLRLDSACGTPSYTNYISTFNGCLDYIYYDVSIFKVSQVVPLPSHEEVTQHIALPSVVCPSDHLALICDLKWL